MYFSKGESYKTTRRDERDAEGNVVLSSQNITGHRDCGFRNSVIYDVMRYPLILLNICCVNVPAPCVCGVKLCDVMGQPLDSSEHKASFLIQTDKGEKETIKISKKPFRGRCPNSDSRAWSLTKKVVFILLVLYEIADNARSCYIAKLSSDKTYLLVVWIGGICALLFILYLRVFNGHSYGKHLKTLFSVALSYEQQYGFKFNQKSFKRKSKIAFCLALLYQTLQCFFFLLSAFIFLIDGPLMKMQMWPYLNFGGGKMYYFCTVASLLSFFSGIIVSGTSVFQTVIVSMLTGEFQSLHNELVSILVEIEKHPSSEAQFDVFVQKLQSLENLMDKSYEVIKHTVAAVYIFGLPKTCVTLYGLISGLIQYEQGLLMCWGMAETIVLMLLTNILLARMQSRARLLADVMYAANWSKFSHEMLQKATLFTTMFTNKSFGMTLYGMFVVDWSTLLMVGGTLLTYSVVIIQFQVGDPTSAASCTKEV